MASLAHAFDLDFGVVARMPTEKEMGVLSLQVIQRAQAASKGYPSARVRGGTLRFVWHKDGDRRLHGLVDIDWNGKARPPLGRVARDGKPICGANGR